MIEKEIINKALSLIGKKMEDMNWIEWTHCSWECEHYEEFSYPKFYAYLLTPEFLYMYRKVIWIYPAIDVDIKFIWEAIYEHQKGNSWPLISLLEKI